MVGHGTTGKTATATPPAGAVDAVGMEEDGGVVVKIVVLDAVEDRLFEDVHPVVAASSMNSITTTDRVTSG